MNRFSGLPILAAIVLGISFPYYAVELMPYGVVLLFILMFWAGLTIDWSKLKVGADRALQILVGLFFLYVFFPLIQLMLANLLISDKQMIYGLVFASLCPVAIVAPYFTTLVNGDEELSFALMVSSMIICPIIAPPLLKFLADSSIAMNIVPLMKYMALLVTLPLFLSFVVWKLYPRLRMLAAPYIGALNIGTLSLLIFILFGTAAGKLNLNYSSISLILAILTLVFIQDFGVLLVSRLVFSNFFDQKLRNALAVSLSMKNVAIAAGLLLFYDPRASLPAALAFLAHAFLFSFISVFRRSSFFLETSRIH